MGIFSYGQLPSWLENNFVFRNLFLVRKLFLTRNRRTYYGQIAEDVAIKRMFPKKYKGFFVDVGCFHPTKYNNTYAYYKKGWRGINIDIDRIKIKGFNWVRRGDINIAKGVSSQKGEMKYWTNGFYSLVNTLDPETAKTRDDYVESIVETDTLTNLIDQTKYKNRPIDLLCIDAEGHDFTVLKSLDFERYDPKLIVVEAFAYKLDEVMDLEITKFLTANNYNLVNWVGLSLMFRKKGHGGR